MFCEFLFLTYLYSLPAYLYHIIEEINQNRFIIARAARVPMISENGKYTFIYPLLFFHYCWAFILHLPSAGMGGGLDIFDPKA